MSNYTNQKKRFDNISLEQKAVTEHNDEKILLHLCEKNFGMNRIYPSKFCGINAEKVEVDTTKIDDYFQNYSKPIIFVKMDLEGSDYGALKGMSEIIHKNNGINILIEFHPDSIEEYGKDPKDIFELLYSYGLTIYHLNKIPKEKELIKPVISTITSSNKQIITIDKFIDLANKDTTNLFCQKTIT